MRVQADQAARATTEQARTMREMTSASAATTRDIKLISEANRSQSVAAARLVTQLADIRRITERNAEGVRQTRGGTADLMRQAETLAGIMGGVAGPAAPNGRGR